MKPQLSNITFRLNLPEARVYLVSQRENDKPVVTEMRRVLGQWYARLALEPGTYRFRYYGGDHRGVTYIGPAHTDGSTADGLDAKLKVSPQAMDIPIELFAAHGCAGWQLSIDSF